MEVDVERRERVIAPLDLVWDEIDSLDGERATTTFQVVWGPLRLPLDVDVALKLTAIGASETRLECRGHLETEHRIAARLRGVCRQIVEGHVQGVVDRVKVRAEQRRLAQERLLL